MKKLIYFFATILILTFVFSACTSQQKAPTGMKAQNSDFDPLLDPRDNNSSLVYPNYRTGYEPNYLNAEGIVLNYSDGNHFNWSWLGLLGLFGLTGLAGRSRKRRIS
jgi:hypothetical protein